MNNRNYNAEVAAGEMLYTNGSGSTIESGTPVRVGKIWGVAHADIADGESGVLQLGGDFTFTKATTADTWSQGDPLTFDADGELVKWTAVSPYPPAGWAPAATTSTDTEARIVLARIAPRRLIRYTCDAADVSASSTAKIVTGIGQEIRLAAPPYIRSSAGAPRVHTDCDIGGSNNDEITIVVTSMAAGDIIDLEVHLASDFTTVAPVA